MKSTKRYKKSRCMPPLSNTQAETHKSGAEIQHSIGGRAGLVNTYGNPKATAVKIETENRQALIDIDGCKRDLKEHFVAPRTTSEKLMASIWTEILKLKEIGVHDNFFDYGRDSFLAMEVIARVRQVFAVNLSVRAMLEEPTVAGMTAAVLRSQYRHRDKPALLDRASESWARSNGAKQLLSRNK